MTTPKIWTTAEIKWLKENARNMSREEVKERFALTDRQFYHVVETNRISFNKCFKPRRSYENKLNSSVTKSPEKVI